ncbi:MAG: hypothetical protein AAFQ43_03265, partial [Bacteroidota bacterium]
MLYLSLAIKGALILAVASGATAALRNAPASLRHGVWVVAFLALLALPALALFGPRLEVPVLPVQAESAVSTPTLVAPATPLAPVGVPAILPPEASEVPLPPSTADAPEPVVAETVVLSEASTLSVAPIPPEATLASGAWTRARMARTALAIWTVGALGFILGWLGTLLAAHHLVRSARPETNPAWLDALEHARLLTGVE